MYMELLHHPSHINSLHRFRPKRKTGKKMLELFPKSQTQIIKERLDKEQIGVKHEG